MTEATVAVIALLVLGWALVSGVWARHDVTGPFVFALAGYVLGNPDWGPLTVNVETTSIHIVAEVTLALVLFSDAARVNVAELRRDLAVPTRLLSVGLLLSVVLGGLLAGWLFSGFPWALAGFMGAALAPTDAALSVQVINDERIPGRIRRALNVESGLNDGIATPIVVFMLAIAASQLGIVAESVTFEAGQRFVSWVAAFSSACPRPRRRGADLGPPHDAVGSRPVATTGSARRGHRCFYDRADDRRERIHRCVRRWHRLRGGGRRGCRRPPRDGRAPRARRRTAHAGRVVRFRSDPRPRGVPQPRRSQ